MKHLIRPLLATIARLGLFLSVAVCLTGQKWTVEFCLPNSTGETTFTICRSGIVFADRGKFQMGAAVYLLPSSTNERLTAWAHFLQNYCWDEPEKGSLETQAAGSTLVPGVRWVPFRPSGGCLAIHHWLPVSLFALLLAAIYGYSSARDDCGDQQSGDVPGSDSEPDEHKEGNNQPRQHCRNDSATQQQ